MGQIVGRIPWGYARSLAQSLRGIRGLRTEPAKGEAIYLARTADGERIEIRDDGTITYDTSARVEALLIQSLKGLLPAPPARYILGLDEAGIGGESTKPYAAGVLLSTDVRAELLVSGIRDCKSIKGSEELSRLAKIIRHNAAFTALREISPPAPGEGFAKKAAESMAGIIKEFLEAGFTKQGLLIRIDQTDTPTLAAVLGDVWDDLSDIIQIAPSSEDHVEVAAASILARAASKDYPVEVKPKSKATAASHPFAIGRWKPGDKEQVITFLRQLDLSYPDIGAWIDKGGQPAKIWQSIEDERYHLLVARVGEEVAGFSLTQKKDDRNWKMSTFYVSPPYRKRNIGPRLLKEEIHRLSKHKCRRLMVTFGHEEFETMQPFFTRYGFTCDGISPQRYRDNSYEVVMAKRFKYGRVGPESFLQFVQQDVFRVTGYDIVPHSDDTFFAIPKQALFAVHQLRPERRYLVRATISSQPELQLPELRRAAQEHDAHPVMASLYGFPAEGALPSDVLVFDAFHLETQFYPLHLERPESRDLVIPIRPEFAQQLFPDRKQATFGPNKFALREDHVYYRIDKGGKTLRRGARLFWYVSGGKQQVVGSARLREVKRGPPRKLWGQFGGLGAWHEEDIEDHVAGQNAMAFVFEWFRESPTKPTYTDIRSLISTFNPITTFALTHAQGDQLLQMAGIG